MQGRKLSDTERAVLLSRAESERAQRKAEYDAVLADFAPGDVGLVTLDGENRVTVRSRLLRAAARRNVTIRFLRKKGRKNELFFAVDTPAAA